MEIFPKKNSDTILSFENLVLNTKYLETSEPTSSSCASSPELSQSHRISAEKKKDRLCWNAAEHVKMVFPILDWLPKYKWSDDFLDDICSGFSLGCFHIAQTFACALLAGLRPIHGLYTTLFTLLLYPVFGSSPTASLGSGPFIALMLNVATLKTLNSLHEQRDIIMMASSTEYDQSIDDHTYEEIVQVTCLLCGIFQVVIGISRLNLVLSLVSWEVYSAFGAGTVTHIFVAQMARFLGLRPKGSRLEVGYIFGHAFELCASLPQANVITVLISITGFAVLFVGKDYINPRVLAVSRYKVAIPWNTLLYIASGLTVMVFGWHKTGGVSIVDTIRTDFPRLIIPKIRLEIVSLVWLDAFEIALASYAVHWTSCKLLSKKSKVKPRRLQESFALGIIHVILSFVGGYPASAPQARAVLAMETAAKSQIHSFVALLTFILNYYVFAPIFKYLPVCIIGVFIMFGFKPLILNVPPTLVKLYNASILDLSIWILTYSCTVVFNVVDGFLLGILISLGGVIIRLHYQPTTKEKSISTSTNGITHQIFDKACTISLNGCLTFLNLHNLEQFSKTYQETLRTAEKVVFDLQSVNFVDFTSAAELGNVKLSLESTGHHPQFNRIPPKIRRALKTVGISEES
ncbi:unnamed protein product [Bursaphelenchus xylophilus]|uniref:(pine wood nematode) hypothetical protein n=1 Tax=Bursaphelenchus xylophilus TaxID=6326 RepID=A0A1I7SPW2_BURXY|nr:unnamed protein product [Bursaphelenchus xylophilus]CAG9109289.1 unnamed protein product [Bursaphelenchus xylophilus]